MSGAKRRGTRPTRAAGAASPDAALRAMWTEAEAKGTPEPLLDLIERLDREAAAPQERRGFDED
jgi:hypothetical protein